MTFASLSKFAGAVAGGVMALSLAAPAQATPISGWVTFDVVYTTTTRSGVSATVNMLLTGTYDAADSNATYDAYQISSLTGTRTTTTKTGTTHTYSLGTLSDPATDINYYLDNLIYFDSATKGAAVDNLGIGYWVSTSDFNLAYDTGSSTYLETVTSDTGDVNEAEAVVKISYVPAPTALALLGASLIGMGLMRRRKSV